MYPEVYRVGFTGTRNGMTPYQRDVMYSALMIVKGFIERRPGKWTLEAHHGCCIGADEQFAKMARDLGYAIVGHPPQNVHNLSTFVNDHDWAPRRYITRNHDIVDVSDEMIATPATLDEVLRSGTWATIRYTTKLGKPLRIVLPEDLHV